MISGKKKKTDNVPFSDRKKKQITSSQNFEKSIFLAYPVESPKKITHSFENIFSNFWPKNIFGTSKCASYLDTYVYIWKAENQVIFRYISKIASYFTKYAYSEIET